MVDEDGEAAANVIAAAVFVVEDADVVVVICKVLKREVADGFIDARLRRNQRIDFEGIVGARPNADQAAENKIDVGGMEVVVRPRQSHDRRTSVRVVILFDVRLFG